jgi:tetratricopeptide (TPR) repeat protein
MIYYKQSKTREAITFFTAASSLQKPETALFVEDCHYGWLPHDYLSTCHLSMGNYQKALESGLKALCDHPNKERLEQNIEFLKRFTEGVPSIFLGVDTDVV